MADTKISAFAAVTTPASTDEFVGAQSGSTYKYTRAQMHTLYGSEQLVGNNAAGPAVLNEAASATNPTLVPNKADLTTGFGASGTADLAIIIGGTRYIELNSTVGVKIHGVALLVDRVGDTATTYSSVAGDAGEGQYFACYTGSGLRWVAGSSPDAESGSDSGSNYIIARYNDSGVYQDIPFNIDRSAGHCGNGAYNDGWALLNQAATATAPSISPRKTDLNTGIGQHSADNLSLIAGGLEGVRVEDPADLVSGETSLWLYDDDNATMEQVTVGAADSGGSGYKLLRIPN